MRDNIQPFIEQYVTRGTLRIWGGDGTREATPGDEPVSGSSFTDLVIEVLRKNPEKTFDVDDVVKVLQENGSHLDRVRVRNSLNYAVRLEKIHRGSRRGTYTLKDTSTPAATGVDAGEEPASGSSGEIGGGRDEASTPPHDQGGRAFNAQFRLDRAGDRAPIGG
jgi:hypothetical protein